MKALRALRALARIEWRQFARHRKRSMLLAVLVAVPVAAVMGGATLVLVTEPTAQEQRLRAMGESDLRIDDVSNYADRVRIEEELPPGARSETIFIGLEEVSVSGMSLRARVIALRAEAVEGIARGRVQILKGRAPRNAGEVALSPFLLDNLDRSLGDAVALEFGAERTITGVVIDPEDLDLPLVLRTPAAVEYRGTQSILAKLPGDDVAATASSLRDAGFSVTTRTRAGQPTDTDSIIFSLGLIGFLEAALVIGAAFAVGLRRRRHEIGLASATGASPIPLWLSLVGSTVCVAFAGAVAGVAVGAASVAALLPFLDSWNRRMNGSFECAHEHVVLSIVLGVMTAVIAAVVPAWNASRLPIRVALGARRPENRWPAAWLVVGVAMVGTGVALTFTASGEQLVVAALGVVVGPVLGLLGFGVMSPWILAWLARRAAPLPLSWRLAVRDAGRFRTRNGPVVTAVTAGMAMSMTIAVFVASLGASLDALPGTYRDDQILVSGPSAERTAERIATTLPTIARAPIEAVYVHGEPIRANQDPASPWAREWIASGDENLLRVLGAESGAGALRAGKLVVVTSEEESTEPSLETWLGGRRVDAPPIHWVRSDQRVTSPRFVMDREAAIARGWQPGPPIDRSLVPWMVRLERPVTEADLDVARSIAGEFSGGNIDAAILRPNPARGFHRVVLALAVFTGLVIVLVATALSAAESAADERVLHTVGASPSLVRHHLAARAAYLALLGCVLALPAGFLPARALFEASNLPLKFVMPWSSALATVFVLPLIAFTTMWIVTRVKMSSAGRPSLRAMSLGLAVLGLASVSARADEIVWEPYVGEAFDGSPLVGELGRLRVPENREDGDGATIDIAFVRYRTSHPNPGPPIFYLEGGPGGSGVEGCGLVATHPQIRLLEHRDVIGIDQRGTGRTRPHLADEPVYKESLPPGRAITRRDAVEALRVAVRRCIDDWTQRGVDLNAYDSAESADDVDAVRRALDVPKIMIYGKSYGSHLGLAYLRRHDEHVERAVLMNVESPDATWKLPSTVQRGLEQFSRTVAADSDWGELLPDAAGTVADLLASLAIDPVLATANAGTADEVTVAVGPYDVQVGVSRALTSVQTMAELPRMLLELSRGDGASWADLALANREVGITAMTLMMDCASGATDGRRARIERERLDRAYLLEDAIMAPYYPEGCDACAGADLGDGFRGPLESTTPVLFVSGSLDIRTPPENVDSIREGFSNHAHVVVQNAAHGGREWMSPEYRRLFQAFSRGEVVQSCTIQLPGPRFTPTEGSAKRTQ